MFCLVALIIFSILGIFSLKYRRLAKEAFHCVFRRITLRPCDTDFNQRIKAKIAGNLLARKKIKLARFWHKYFEVFSWIFIILLLLSLFFSARAVFNLAKFGSCDPHSTNCIFKPGVVECGGSKCKTKCLCEEVGCNLPKLEACQGDCDCIKDVCAGGTSK